MVRRSGNEGIGTASAYDLLTHADEEGFIEDIDEVLGTKEQPAKPAAKAPKKLPNTARSTASASSTAAGSSARAASQRQDQLTGKARAEDYYRAFQHCYKDQPTGEVVLRFHKTNIVRVKPNGDVMLTTGGWFTFTTLSAMNDALYAINLAVTHQGPVSAGVWAVQDDMGRVLPYKDNMIITASRMEHRNRAATVMKAYSGGSEVPVYAVKPSAAGGVRPRAAAGPQQAARTGPGTMTFKRTSYTTGNPYSGSYAGAISTSSGQTYASQLSHTSHQPQPYNAAVVQQRPAAAGHGPHKSAHEQLAEAVEALGMQDELVCGDEHLCVVCLERERDEVLVPCGHMVLCRMCCINIMDSNNECPVCREVIVDHCTVGPNDP